MYISGSAMGNSPGSLRGSLLTGTHHLEELWVGGKMPGWNPASVPAITMETHFNNTQNDSPYMTPNSSPVPTVLHTAVLLLSLALSVPWPKNSLECGC